MSKHMPIVIANYRLGDSYCVLGEDGSTIVEIHYGNDFVESSIDPGMLDMYSDHIIQNNVDRQEVVLALEKALAIDNVFAEEVYLDLNTNRIHLNIADEVLDTVPALKRNVERTVKALEDVRDIHLIRPLMGKLETLINTLNSAYEVVKYYE